MRLKKLAFFSAVLGASLISGACDTGAGYVSESGQTPLGLIGTWRYPATGQKKREITFRADQTVTVTYFKRSGPVSHTAPFIVVGDLLVIRQQLAPGTTEHRIPILAAGQILAYGEQDEGQILLPAGPVTGPIGKWSSKSVSKQFDSRGDLVATWEETYEIEFSADRTFCASNSKALNSLPTGRALNVRGQWEELTPGKLRIHLPYQTTMDLRLVDGAAIATEEAVWVRE